jgi:hypothetical protein
LRQGFGQLARSEDLHEGAQTAEEPAGDACHQREVGDPRHAAIGLDAQGVQRAIVGQEEAIEHAIVVELREKARLHQRLLMDQQDMWRGRRESAARQRSKPGQGGARRRFERLAAGDCFRGRRPSQIIR